MSNACPNKAKLTNIIMLLAKKCIVNIPGMYVRYAKTIERASSMIRHMTIMMSGALVILQQKHILRLA